LHYFEFTMHIALMEPADRRAADQVAELCAESGTSLHLIGPVGFDAEDFEGENAGSALDLWVHPDWFEFRRAIARERCYYFSAEGTKTIEEARVRPTSVLMFAGPEGMPARIKEKYPHRMYKLPADGVDGVKAVLRVALEKAGGRSTALSGATEPAAPPRRSGRSAKGGRGRAKS
jgi:tRNA (cytidine/uridine-2'-O-)-methyltransferase